MGRKAEEVNVTVTVEGKPTDEQIFKVYEMMMKRGLWINEEGRLDREAIRQSL